MNEKLYWKPVYTVEEMMAIIVADEAENNMDELTGQDLADDETWAALLVAYRKLKASKPEERSEKARRYAVAITEMEKAMAYFYTMVMLNFEG